MQKLIIILLIIAVFMMGCQTSEGLPSGNSQSDDIAVQSSENEDIQANDSNTEGSAEQPSTDLSVSKFALNKFYFFDLDITGEDLTADSEVLAAIADIADLWQYSCDCYAITFFCDENVDRGIFDALKFSRIEEWNIPLRIYIEIPYADLDVEVLQELSNNESINNIHITGTAAYEAVPDGE